MRQTEALACQAYDYSKSRPFDVWKWSEAPEANKAVEHLYTELKVHSGNLVEKNRAKYRNTIKKVILDLYVAHLDDPNLFVSYSRDVADYAVGKRYKKLHIGYRPLVTVVDALQDLGYVHNKLGFFDRKRGIGKQSRMIATEKLILLIESAPVKRNAIVRVRDEIELRDENKKPIDYTETPQIKSWRKKIQAINQSLMAASVTLDLTQREREELFFKMGYFPDTTRKTLHRVFNNRSFRQGGRFYGHWVQGLPSEYRNRLRINGKEVVELDYSAFHPTILYLHAECELPLGDMYSIEGYDPSIRPFLKRSLLIAINANSVVGAAKAILTDDINRVFRFDYRQIREILEKLVKKHDRIARFIYSGMGIELQFMDSELAEEVMLKMMKQGIVALPVHDSFVCPEESESELHEAMLSTFRGTFGAEIGIDRKFG